MRISWGLVMIMIVITILNANNESSSLISGTDPQSHSGIITAGVGCITMAGDSAMQEF